MATGAGTPRPGAGDDHDGDGDAASDADGLSDAIGLSEPDGLSDAIGLASVLAGAVLGAAGDGEDPGVHATRPAASTPTRSSRWNMDAHLTDAVADGWTALRG